MPTVLLLRAALVVSFGLSLGLAPRMALATGNTYSEAPVITKSQFLHELKEVAVTFAFDPWLAKYVSEAEQQAYVTKALARYNIAVRSNAPVSLLVTLDHVPTTIRETTTFFRRPDQITIYQDHNFYYSMGFFVRAAALRDGKLHPLIASPARIWGTFAVEENNEVRKLIIGDELRPEIMQSLAQAWPQLLETIASATLVDTARWPVNGWTEKQKAAANASYTTIMNPQSKVENRPIDGLNSVPELELIPVLKEKRCVTDPLWRSLWQAEFQRLGWVKTQGESVALNHNFSCDVYGSSSYLILMDEIELRESNLVFELNGRLVRKPATIFSSHRMMTPLPDQLAATLQGYIPRSITEFATNLTLGNQTLPEVAIKTPTGVTAPSPAKPAAEPSIGDAILKELGKAAAEKRQKNEMWEVLHDLLGGADAPKTNERGSISYHWFMVCVSPTVVREQSGVDPQSERTRDFRNQITNFLIYHSFSDFFKDRNFAGIRVIQTKFDLPYKFRVEETEDCAGDSEFDVIPPGRHP